MLTGTAVVATVRGKAEQSEILQIPAPRLRRALGEIPSVSETIVRALIMRRKRLQRDREFTGLRILAEADSREGHQLDDFHRDGYGSAVRHLLGTNQVRARPFRCRREVPGSRDRCGSDPRPDRSSVAE